MSARQRPIPCSIYRGGTSRGLYILENDLPGEEEARERLLLAVAGGPDALQVDGIGGGHPLTNKVAVVGPSSRDDADIDYLFLQLIPGESRISATQNCGNILVGVGPFALDAGLAEPSSPRSAIRVHMVNSGNLCELTLETPDGEIAYGNAAAAGEVSTGGTSVICDYLDVAGSVCGSLLPTGSVSDVINGVSVTCIDNGMPVVVLRATDLGLTGSESPDELDADQRLGKKLEDLRLAAGFAMNLGDVEPLTVPKICLVSAPRAGGLISTRTFIPHVCHRAVGILGAVSVATACLIPGSVCADLADVPRGLEKELSIEHPSGALSVRLVVDETAAPDELVKRAGVIRTARLIMRGRVFVP